MFPTYNDDLFLQAVLWSEHVHIFKVKIYIGNQPSRKYESTFIMTSNAWAINR